MPYQQLKNSILENMRRVGSCVKFLACGFDLEDGFLTLSVRLNKSNLLDKFGEFERVNVALPKHFSQMERLLELDYRTLLFKIERNLALLSLVEML